MRTIGFCEIDPFAREVLKKHWPHVPCLSDITAQEFHRGEADIICGGFPCQDISGAGSRAGITGSRSGLWRELVRAIRVVRPCFAIVENVAALLGFGMDRVLGDLAEIGNDAEWNCIPACAVGAPHRRDRVWIVAYPAGERCGEARPNSERQEKRLASGCNALADANEPRLSGWLESALGAAAGHAQSERQGGVGGERWPAEPNVGRVAHGIPRRVDRLRTLGNAVVPQIPEIIGRAIMKTSLSKAYHGE